LRTRRDSVIWSDDFLGTPTGHVTSGPYAGWTVLNALPNSTDLKLWRAVDSNPEGGLFQDSDVKTFTNYPDFGNFSFCTSEAFEGTHGLAHDFVGGFMGNIVLSPNDPVFYSHHCFVDFMWEQFRQNKQTAHQREHYWPPVDPQCSVSVEFASVDHQMAPFNQTNKAGLSPTYTGELYKYDERPQCNEEKTACTPESKWLFCDKKSNRCVTKVVLGGDCNGYEDEDICYQGQCDAGKCVAATESPTEEESK